MKSNTESWTDCLRWVALAAFTVPFLLLCSCNPVTSAYSHKFNYGNYGYPGDPRPADEAILTGHQMYNPKKHTLGSPLVSKVDDHSCSIMPADWSGRGPIGTNTFEVRLLPGPHIIQVEPFLNGAIPTFTKDSKPIAFEAVAGRHYDLTLELLDWKPKAGGARITWTSKIIEVETGKEFHFDTP